MHDMMLSAVVRKEGRLYVANALELDIASQGKSPEEAVANLKEAVELYLQDEDAVRPTGRAVFMTTFEVAYGAKAAGAVGA